VIMLGDKLLMFLKDCSAVIFRVKAVKEWQIDSVDEGTVILQNITNYSLNDVISKQICIFSNTDILEVTSFKF
jgi:hypothetical protein